MKKFNNLVLIAVMAVILGLSIIFNSTPTPNYTFHYIHGDLIDFDDYKGKYSVLTFTFTRCPSICPAINLDLEKLRYRYGENINILTINVDPEHDTPDVLRKFMDINQYEWDVLVGSYQDIRNIGKVKLNSDRELKSPGEHLPNLYLMDKDFDYINKFFPLPPERSEVVKLFEQLDSLVGLDTSNE